MSKIEVITGPMFSGKTTMLIKRVEGLKKDKKIKVFKPRIDDRYKENAVCSHDNVSVEAINTENMKDIDENTRDADVVVIDEFHFFPSSLINYFKKWQKEGKHIIAAGLNTDYKGEEMMFLDLKKGFNDLKKIADDITYLTSKCYICGEDATLQLRTADSKELKLVGGKEAYQPVCEKHHPKWKKE